MSVRVAVACCACFKQVLCICLTEVVLHTCCLYSAVAHWQGVCLEGGVLTTGVNVAMYYG